MLTSEKTRGIGAGLLIWLLLTMIYDSVLLYLVFLLGEYPIERPLMGLLMLNPLDLVRFQIILQMDASAMMGYSGAAMKEFLGATGGMIVSAFLLTVWAALPYALSLRLQKKRPVVFNAQKNYPSSTRRMAIILYISNVGYAEVTIHRIAEHPSTLSSTIF